MAAPRTDTEALIAQLEQASSLAPCTVLCGDEILLQTELADALRAAALRLGCSERQHFVLDARSNWTDLLAQAQSSSLFGDMRFLELSIPSAKPGKQGADALQKLLQLVQDGKLTDLWLLVRLPALDWASQKLKWVQNLKASARWIDVPSIGRQELPGWLAARLARLGLSAAPETLHWLGDKVEGNLLAAHQELAKLALLYPAGELSLAQVQAAVLNVARYNPYDLRDAMLLGEARRALDVLLGLRAEGEPLVLILWILGEEIRTLARIARLPASEHASAMRAQRIFGPREAMLRGALRRLPARSWLLALAHAQKIDRLIKGVPAPNGLPDAWQELAQLLIHTTAGSPS